MSVVVNGFPKSGCHALLKACELLGVPVPPPGRVQHAPFGMLPAGTTKHLFIRRDPRNVLVSWLRWRNQPVTPGMFLTAFRYFQDAPLIVELARYEPWLTDPTTLVVCFEDLLASDAETRRIARFLGVPYIDDAFAEIDTGHTMTWNAVHSDYRTIWTPQVEAAWVAEGGPQLLTRWGY